MDKHKVKLAWLLQEYKKLLIISMDYLKSNQAQQIRRDLRGKAVMFMGKKSLMRLALQNEAQSQPNLLTILPLIKNKIGLVFTNDDPIGVARIIQCRKVSAFAKAKSIAEEDLWIYGGPTNVRPHLMSSFTQLKLDIPIQIRHAQIDVLHNVRITRKGQRVSRPVAEFQLRTGFKLRRVGDSIMCGEYLPNDGQDRRFCTSLMESDSFQVSSS